MKINGKEIAQKIIDDFKKQRRPDKSLAAILIGKNAQSESFLKQKIKIAGQLGIDFRLIRLSGEIGEPEVIKEIEKLNLDESVGGIILQLPLPEKFNRDKIIAAIDFVKDVDALNSKNNLVLPPAVEAVKEILKTQSYKLKAKKVAVVGARGFLIGSPISKWLEGRCKKLILLDIGDDLSQIREADLVISGVGRAGLIKPKMLKAGTAVIDFGYSFATQINADQNADSRRKISGDLDISNLRPTTYDLRPNFWYTPTPGGTGPILVAELFRNFYKLNKTS
jgi:methylenetetrahydrofolate dehydrogenase (NADP+)/methenyltetrahydrofolate cyclohydrolase